MTANPAYSHSFSSSVKSGEALTTIIGDCLIDLITSLSNPYSIGK